MMNLEERIQQSESRVLKAVFPNTTNHYDTLFSVVKTFIKYQKSRSKLISLGGWKGLFSHTD